MLALPLRMAHLAYPPLFPGGDGCKTGCAVAPARCNSSLPAELQQWTYSPTAVASLMLADPRGTNATFGLCLNVKLMKVAAGSVVWASGCHAGDPSANECWAFERGGAAASAC